MKVWQNKSKGAKKASKSKKKKLTKKKPVSQQQVKGDKAKQANGNVAGNVSVQSQLWLEAGFPSTVQNDLRSLLWLFQEMAAAAKEEDEEVSDKGSESDEAEATKDSPSERDDESDKQSDTEADEVTGDDEEVCALFLGGVKLKVARLNAKLCERK